MTKGLFREEALENQRDRLEGEVFMAPSLLHQWTAILLTVWVIALFYWLSTSSYSTKENVFGWLESAEGIEYVFPERQGDIDGVVEKIYVKNGDYVEKGAPLFLIGTDKNLASGDVLSKKILEEYDKRKELIGKQMEGTKLIHQKGIELLKSRIKSFENSLKYLALRENALNGHHKLLSERVAKLESLEFDGHTSGQTVENDAIRKLEIEANIQALQGERIEIESQIQATNLQIVIDSESYENNLNSLRRELSEIKAVKSQFLGQQSYLIRAQKSGRVNSLQATEGVKPRRDKPLLSIVPPDSELLAYLLVPVKSIAFVKPGLKVNMRYDAFPYQRFGSFEGQIISISDSITLPGQLLQSPLENNIPVYLITAKIMEQKVNAFDEEFDLKPGMTFSSEIYLKDATVLELLFQPLMDLKEGWR